MKNTSTKIGFIGIGVMGYSMAGHLLKAGYTVNVFNRTQSKTQGLLDSGAIWQNSPAEVAGQSDIVITMVGFPRDVEEVYLGKQGIFQAAKPDTVILDMTTSSPKLAKMLYEKGLEKKLQVLDAPVSGGDIGAREAKLSIMVGGDEKTFNKIKSVLAIMGTNIVYQGPAGAGQHTKMCNQIAIASNMMGVCEALAYAKKAGLNPNVVLDSIKAGAAGSFSLSNLAPRILAGNFAPGFYVKHFIKDLGIALDSAQEMGLRTPGLALAKSLYDELAAMGEENSGTQALYKLYDC